MTMEKILEKLESLETDLKNFKDNVKRIELKCDQSLTLARAIADKVM